MQKKKIYKELVKIRKELQAIHSSLELKTSIDYDVICRFAQKANHDIFEEER